MIRALGWAAVVLALDSATGIAQQPKGSSFKTQTAKSPEGKSPDGKSPVARHASNFYARALASSPLMLSSDVTHSVWRVFFATNRVRLVTNEDQHPSYGPQPASPPRLDYGECEVVVPTFVNVANGTAEKSPTKPTRPSAATAKTTGSRKVQTTPYNRFFEELVRAVSQSPQHDVLVYVPGYNTRFEEAVYRTGQLAADLPFNGVVICYSWPSAGSKLTYTQDVEHAEGTVRHLWRFLSALHNHLGSGTRINLVAHGMGCRALMQGVAAMPKNIREARPFQHLVLTNPDLGVDEFSLLAEKCVAAARHVTLYVSQGDETLFAGKNPSKQAQRAGDASKMTIVPHVDTIDVTLVDRSFLGQKYQAGDRTVLNELFQLIKLDDPPAHRPWLRAAKADGKTYWQLVDKPPAATQAERPSNKK